MIFKETVRTVPPAGVLVVLVVPHPARIASAPINEKSLYVRTPMGSSFKSSFRY
jgi:hypothetical protein